MSKQAKIVAGTLSLVLVTGWLCILLAGESKTDAAAQTMTTNLHVEIKEAVGRRVEGIVRGHTLAVDQPKEFGATDTAPTPPETLAFALGACVVSTARYIAMLENLNLREIKATVDGNLDFARASGQPTSARAGYSNLEVKVSWKTSLDAHTQQRLLERILDRCPMCDNLAHVTPLKLVLSPNIPQP